MRHVSAACLFFLLTPLSLAASENSAVADQESYGHSTVVGINFPGVNVRRFFSDSFAVELRGQYEHRILTAGPRLYYYPSFANFNNGHIRPFISIEGAYVSFKGQFSEGRGLAYGANGGVEYFLSRRISVQTDVGPYYIMLNDKNTSIEQTGLEFVLNFGINLYFL